MNTTQINHFDRGKPFYPLVMNYLIQLHSFKILAVRGIIGSRQADEAISKLISDRFKDTDSKQVEDIRTVIAQLLGPLELRSEFQNNRITADTDEICQELASNSSYLLPYYFRAAGVLLVLAYYMTETYNKKKPLWEFLRHCRNAVAHNGLFYFKNKEPSKQAAWGPFAIERKLQDTPLFKDIHGSGMLSPGDPIRLLWDIEQAYPNIKA